MDKKRKVTFCSKPKTEVRLRNTHSIPYLMDNLFSFLKSKGIFVPPISPGKDIPIVYVMSLDPEDAKKVKKWLLKQGASHEDD